ncbi:RagB/SusD family nutrient uptake outer membrane protein [Flavivirga rizhaonensis]|uniref:RagB/SusD family nutrient uptake outer membrane protein n=1 Tax=Flavivirga rizhaonensis TaxID=2559571 RepID=A0A4S1DRP7_9FLAO|nr:RagB/SusD family nutrient uptake outer membrane protein [Flavivirga rizhaonensis]TGV00559.1 RagB/SusD family nutrient uptake outer membrane protein [Flavivirga rizhaonensis]
MKFTYIKISLVVVALLSLNSCNIDDVVPQNALEESNVIRDEASAITLLNRIYTTYRGPAGSGLRVPLLHPTVTSRLSAAGQELQYVRPDSEGVADHNILPSSNLILTIYRSEYYTINNTNFFIELVENGAANVDDTRKNELLAEARFFRGYSHFNLLRVFGQFYDTNSEFGIVGSTTPYRENETRPRNTVQENYDLIISDLQFAADNGRTNREHFYISATAARAALAKVQLYMGDYTNAAANALSVINNTDGYALATSYGDIFNTKYGPETIFAPFAGDIVEGEISISSHLNSVASPSTYFRILADDQDGVPGDGSFDNTTGYDPRYSFVFSDPAGNPKYPFAVRQAGGGNTVNMLRMAEMYLIYAEAEARRSGGVLADALDKLNDIRNRAGVPPKMLSDKATLLEDIRNEKILELFKETGESWFDFVRYDRLGDIDAAALRPTITNPGKLIFPIPQSALAGNNALVPNP